MSVPVVGRERELEALRRLLDAVRRGEPAALHLAGEPGIGKTALLDAARAMAHGVTCLFARGVESEATLSHAGLLQLLTPVRHLLAEVPGGQAAALGVALGWTSGQANSDRFLVAAGTLSLLAAAAADRPVAVLVDDLQWLDRESAEAITFAARRLDSDAVGFVMNGRAGDVPPGLLAGLQVLTLDGIDEAAAAQLLVGGVAPAVAERLASLTGGNPLALLEVAARLTTAQRVGAAPLPEPLPVGERLDTVYDAVLAGLRGPVRDVALLAALDTVAVAAVAEPDVLDEAVARGILHADAKGYTLRHPLLRSAVLRLATPAQHRAAHRALAGSCGAGTSARAHHLAAAATSPDESLAAELARISDVDRARLGYAAAAAALARSAALTRDPVLAADRLSSAARDAFVAGDLATTRRLTDQVLASSAPPDARGHALFTLGMVEQYAGSVPRAATHLTDACSLLQGALLVDALTELALVAFRLGDIGRFVDCATRIDAAADLGDPAQRLRASFTGGLACFLGGDHEAARSQLREVAALALSDDLRDDPRSILLMALAAALTGTVTEAIAQGSARVDDVRRRGAIGALMPILAILSRGRAMVGDHAAAFADAGEAAELAEHLGYVSEGAVAVEHLAWQSAARGLHDDARAALTRARTLIERAETTSAAAHHALTVAFCALCRDDVTETVEVLEARLAIDGGAGALGEPLGVAPLLAEAYVALGRTADAVELTRRYAEVTPASAADDQTALVLRCRALTAPDASTAERHFRAALERHAGSTDPFEEARTRLLLGVRLRRDGQRVAAREHLRAAETAFAAMDLTRWVGAAAAELAATGATRGGGAAVADAPLTSQETRVALLVAEGRTNKDVAAALFLSPKTIERHLASVFRKKGYRSRSELVRAYASRAGEGGPDVEGSVARTARRGDGPGHPVPLTPRRRSPA